MLKFVKRYVRNILDRKPIVINGLVKKEIDELIDSCYLVKIELGSKNLPSEKVWFRFQIELLNNILNKNPLEFLKWEGIKGAMCPSFPVKFIKDELDELKKSEVWLTRWKVNLNESSTGCSQKYPYLFKSSGNLIHQAYNLHQFEKISNKTINKFDFIFEFGGGYGATCNLINRLGFRGKYIIYDLYIFSSLQKFYLKLEQNDVSKIPGKNKINTFSNLKDVESTIKQSNLDNSMFIANWSLTETPIKIRSKFHPLMKNFNNVLIAFRDVFGEVDNMNYVEQFKGFFQPKIKWNLIENPYQPKNYYLIGFN